MRTLEHLRNGAALFTQKLFGELEKIGLLELLDDAIEIDHICYRVEDIESYECWANILSREATLLSEAFVNGRPICAYKFHKPFKLTNAFYTNILELPAPKQGQHYDEGFEHIEVVTSKSLESILEKYSQIKFSRKLLNSQVNPEISFQVGASCIKLHKRSLEKIISEEIPTKLIAREKSLVVIDFDDTLVNSKNQFLSATHRALCSYLQKDLEYEDFKLKSKPTFPEFFAEFGIHSPQEFQEIIAKFQYEWKKEIDSVQIPAGIKSLLSCLNHEGIKVVVWTARDLDSASEYLENNELSPFIKKVYAYCNGGASKPNPCPELLQMSRLNSTIVLGDSISDKIGAENLKSQFFQATWVRDHDFGVPIQNQCRNPLDFLTKAMDYFDKSNEM